MNFYSLNPLNQSVLCSSQTFAKNENPSLGFVFGLSIQLLKIHNGEKASGCQYLLFVCFLDYVSILEDASRGKPGSAWKRCYFKRLHSPPKSIFSTRSVMGLPMTATSSNPDLCCRVTCVIHGAIGLLTWFWASRYSASSPRRLPWARLAALRPLLAVVSPAAPLGSAVGSAARPARLLPLLWVAPAHRLTLIPPGKVRGEETGAELVARPQHRPAPSRDRADKRGRQRREGRAATAAAWWPGEEAGRCWRCAERWSPAAGCWVPKPRSPGRPRPAWGGAGGCSRRTASPSSTTVTRSCARRWCRCGCSAPPSAGSTRWGAASRAGSSWSSSCPTTPVSMSLVSALPSLQASRRRVGLMAVEEGGKGRPRGALGKRASRREGGTWREGWDGDEPERCGLPGPNPCCPVVLPPSPLPQATFWCA